MIKTEQIVAIEKAKLKLLKLLSSINNALCDTIVLSFFSMIKSWKHGAFGYSRLTVTQFSDLDGSVSKCPKVLCAFLVN